MIAAAARADMDSATGSVARVLRGAEREVFLRVAPPTDSDEVRDHRPYQ